MLTLFIALAFSFSLTAQAAPAAKPAGKIEKALPYLGPGADKLSKEEYEKIYKNYIQTSLLLGYPLLRDSPEACAQALNATFRQAGMFSYPVPGEGAQVKRTVRKVNGSLVENYELGGVLLQLQKNSGTDAPERLFWINSGSPKATRRLAEIARKEVLTLEKDKITGLERVMRIPVGYPHMLLGNEGQGLQVRIIRFNGKKDGCEPEEFSDNAWSGGFDLNDARCASLQDDVQKVWSKNLSTANFYERELKRMKDLAVKDAVARGTSPAEARALVDKNFVPPFAAEINVVGTAMKNLAQCNLFALGNNGVKKASPAPSAPPEEGTSMETKSSSAR
ncbi:MAG: hypothetical protein EOP11_09165 [Proteobacteria bacterium]|nr:MAG: hypothetical protein EOP11_09165 [Pseudomonadota bacterium]